MTAAIEAQIAQSRLNVALSTIKSSAEADQAIADIVQEAADNVPVSSSRGSNVNIRA